MGWSTPPGPRGLLCDPPVDRWNALAEQNRRRLAAGTFDIQGVPASKLRAEARRRVLALAGLSGEDGERPLFVTGHQPEFYHPGVWVKAFAVAEAARRAKGFGLNFVVDHDAGELAAEIPRREPVSAPPGGAEAAGKAGGAAGAEPAAGGAVGSDSVLSVHGRRLVPAGSGRPFETLPGPDKEQAEAFVTAVEDDLSTLGLEREQRLWRTFAEGMLDLVREGVESAAELGWRSRAAYEKAFGVKTVPDVPFSALAGSREFLLFFVDWVVRAEEMAAAYNAALAEVRRARRLRSEANPFPDLLLHPEQGMELPFWGLTPEGVRRKLYVRREGDRLVLRHLEGVFASVPASGGEGAVEELLAAAVRVRPRAVPLTLFVRLFVADVFVHGTGGARYDEVTDLIIKKRFGLEPPRYAVVSATMHLPLEDLPVQPSALQALEHTLRDLVFNPQRHAWEAFGRDEERDKKMGELVRHKEQLIDEISKLPRRRGKGSAGVETGGGAESPGPTSGPSRKRVLTRAIEKTNAELYSLLQDVERSRRDELAELRRRARSGQVAGRRTYPFFLFDPKDVGKLLRNGGS